MMNVWQQAVEIWQSGGWGMIALAVNALLVFALGSHVYLRLQEKAYRKLDEDTWRAWIAHPEQRQDAVGSLIDVAMESENLHEMTVVFDEYRSVETVPFERNLRVMSTCVNCAPLMGLLGTVTGMLSTFHALAYGSGGDKTMDMIASGISEALITTETGLIVALPGLLFQYHLVRKHAEYTSFLLHLETACSQALYRNRHKSERKEVA